MAPAFLVVRERLGRAGEQPDRLEQEVVEVERAGLLEPLAISDREPSDRPLVVVDGVLSQERRVEHLVLRPADRPQHRARAELAGQRQVLLAEDLLHQRLLVVGVVDDEPAADADRLAVAAQDASAERVEGARVDVATGLADERDDPLAQLPGGAIRERDREDRPGPDVPDPDQVRDAVGEDAGLAAAGAGQDQQRALGCRDGPCLLGVEALDDLVSATLGVPLAGRLLPRLEREALVLRELRWLLPGEWRLAQPLRLRGGRAVTRASRDGWRR